MVAQQVGKGEAVRGDHLQPPGSIALDHILAHALDHLALLKGSDTRINAVLEPGWVPVLETRLPKPAGYVYCSLHLMALLLSNGSPYSHVSGGVTSKHLEVLPDSK